jgi:ribosomal protein L7/L12
MKNEIVTLNHGNVSVTGPFNEVFDMLRSPEQSNPNPNVNQNSEQILIRIFEYLRVDYDKQKIQMIKVARTYFNMGLGDAKKWVETNCSNFIDIGI